VVRNVQDQGRQGGRSPGREKPLWTDIRIVGGDGKPAKEIPLKDGHFEMALFEGNPKAITLTWIAFYRR
jgi:hypothetical protein